MAVKMERERERKKDRQTETETVRVVAVVVILVVATAAAAINECSLFHFVQMHYDDTAAGLGMNRWHRHLQRERQTGRLSAEPSSLLS